MIPCAASSAQRRHGVAIPKRTHSTSTRPRKNDGKTIYRLKVKDVPVDGFWSVSVYNSKGYFEPNRFNAYTLNNITAKPNGDGSISHPVRRL